MHQPFQTTFGWSFLRSSTSERPFVGGAEGHQNDLLLVSFDIFKRLLVGQTPFLNDFLIQCQQTALLCEISAAFQRLIVGSYHRFDLFQTTFGWSFLRSSTSERLIVGDAGKHQNDLLLVSFGAFKRLIVGKKRIMLFFKHLLTKKSFCANMYIEVKRQ